MIHKKLDVYILSIKLVGEIYKFSQVLPRDEKFGIISQLKRACVSIPLNISEGSSRKSPKDKQHFYRISLGSANEVETIFDILEETQMSRDYSLRDFRTKLIRIRKMLQSLIKSLN